MKSTVIVPTYRRPQDLARCLRALNQQINLPAEVIVVVRDHDADTWAMLETLKSLPLPLKTVIVTVPGVIAAMNAGVEAATGDIVAFTDDDAAPHTDWLQRIEAHFLANDRVGGVGGRDLVQRSEPWFGGERAVVGLLQWQGRVIGEHHRGVGAAREVDVLKGVNMSFRRQVFDDLRFDERLRGTGAQVHFEIAFCLTLRRQGWKLIYDPAVLVDHYIAQRFDEDQRNQFNVIAFANAVHNETLALLEHLSFGQRLIFLLWAVIVGTLQAPGFVQWIRLLPSEKAIATQKWLASMQGRWQGWQTWRQSQLNHTTLRITTNS
jgi:cellulose synthase/poly-beta-1,6-N-acetylglucosamine synthase-like glycosyltransferase